MTAVEIQQVRQVASILGYELILESEEVFALAPNTTGASEVAFHGSLAQIKAWLAGDGTTPTP